MNIRPSPKRKPTPQTTSRLFSKNDSGFVCRNCGAAVPPLLSSSRDHCTRCMCSVHVDINPGDRANTCNGLLVPIGVEQHPQKGFIIKYHCDTCGEMRNCKSAPDDDFDEIVRLSAHPAHRLRNLR